MKPSFGLQAGRALYSKFCTQGAYFTYSQWSEMQSVRNYGAGMQSAEPYINWHVNGSPIGQPGQKINNNSNGQNSNNAPESSGGRNGGGRRKAFSGIDYSIFSPMAKHTNILVAMMAENEYRPSCNSLDKNTIAARKRNKHQTLIRSKLINPLAKELGLPEMPVPFVPRDEQEAEMADRLGFYKTKQEVALEKLGESALRTSNWDSYLRDKINRDAIDFGFRCARLCRDRITGQVKYEYVDPCNLVMLWNESSEDEPVAIGDIFETTIQAIYPELKEAGLSDEQISAMAKQQVAYQQPGTQLAPWIWERKDNTTNRWLWMDFKVFVLRFEYLSTDYKKYSERDIKGRKYYQKIGDINAVKKSAAEEISEPDEYRCNYWYEGNYIISGAGMDMVYGWRKKPNQMQVGLSPLSSYVFSRILGQSHTRRVIGNLNDLQCAMLKLRGAYAAAAPKGYVMDISSAANMKIGGKEYDLFDQIHIHRQNGIRLVSMKWNQSTQKYMVEAFKSEDNGLGPQGLEWIQQIANNLNLIMDTLGIPDALAATPAQSAERLPGVIEQDVNAGNMANNVLLRTEQDFARRLFERAILQSRIDIEYDEKCRETYESIIGPEYMASLKEIEGISLDKMGISIKVLPNEKERDAIMMSAQEMAKIATRDGSVLLKPSSVERVRQLLKNGDVDEALWFMASEETQSREREEQNAKEMAQMTFKGQQESAVVAEQAKQQTATIVSNLRMAEIAREEQKEINVMKAKYEFETPSKIAQIEVKADREDAQIDKEIAGELLTGENIKNNTAA